MNKPKPLSGMEPETPPPSYSSLYHSQYGENNPTHTVIPIPSYPIPRSYYMPESNRNNVPTLSQFNGNLDYPPRERLVNESTASDAAATNFPPEHSMSECCKLIFIMVCACGLSTVVIILMTFVFGPP